VDIWTPSFTLTWWKLGLKKSSLSEVYAPQFHPVDDWEYIGLKKSSLSGVYAPRFHAVDDWEYIGFKSRV